MINTKRETAMAKAKKWKRRIALTSILRLAKYASPIPMVGDPSYRNGDWADRCVKVYQHTMAEKRAKEESLRHQHFWAS